MQDAWKRSQRNSSSCSKQAIHFELEKSYPPVFILSSYISPQWGDYTEDAGHEIDSEGISYVLWAGRVRKAAIMGRGRIYTDKYKQICFDTWVLNGRPTIVRLHELIPVSEENGHKPNIAELTVWRNTLGWDMNADIVDARVEEQNLDLLVQKKNELLKIQLEQVTVVATKALEYLKSDGFDSSSSAVQAFYRGMEEQRKIAGFSDLLEKLESMSNNQVRDEIVALINRATENDQIVEGTEVAGTLDDTVSEEE